MSSPYCYHKANMFSDVIVLVSPTPFHIYDITSCNYSHMPLHHPRKEKEKVNQKKRNIKSRKIDKNKRKILVSKYTITRTDIRRKGKMEKVTEFVERMRKVQEEARVALRKA